MTKNMPGANIGSFDFSAGRAGQRWGTCKSLEKSVLAGVVVDMDGGRLELLRLGLQVPSAEICPEPLFTLRVACDHQPRWGQSQVPSNF